MTTSRFARIARRPFAGLAAVMLAGLVAALVRYTGTLADDVAFRGRIPLGCAVVALVLVLVVLVPPRLGLRVGYVLSFLAALLAATSLGSRGGPLVVFLAITAMLPTFVLAGAFLLADVEVSQARPSNRL